MQTDRYTDKRTDRQAGRQTDMMKLIVASCNFANVLKNSNFLVVYLVFLERLSSAFNAFFFLHIYWKEGILSYPVMYEGYPESKDTTQVGGEGKSPLRRWQNCRV
jgi:hypothetical protein